MTAPTIAKLAPNLVAAPVEFGEAGPVVLGSLVELSPVVAADPVPVPVEPDASVEEAFDEVTVVMEELEALVEVECSLVEVLEALVDAEEALVEVGATVEETLEEVVSSPVLPVLAVPVPPEILMLCQLPVLSP